MMRPSYQGLQARYTKCARPHLREGYNYYRTGFNCKDLIIANCEFFKLLIHKLILLIAHPYVQFVQRNY